MKLYSDSIVLQDKVIAGVLHIEGQSISAIEEGGDLPYDALNFKGCYIMPGLINIQNNMFLEGKLYESFSTNNPGKKLSYIDRVMASVGVTTCYHDVSLERSLERGDKRYLYQALDSIRQTREGGFAISHKSHFKMRLGHLENMDFLMELGSRNLLDFITYRGYLKENKEHVRNAYYAAYVQNRFGLSDAMTHQMVERVIHLRNEASLDLFPYLRRMLSQGQVPMASSRESIIRRVEELYRESIPIFLNPREPKAMKFAVESKRFLVLDVDDMMKDVRAKLDHILPEQLILTSKCRIFDFTENVFRLSEILGLPQAVALVTAQPARAMGQKDIGTLEVGKKADIIVVDPHGSVPLNRLTISGGKIVYQLNFPGKM